VVTILEKIEFEHKDADGKTEKVYAACVAGARGWFEPRNHRGSDYI